LEDVDFPVPEDFDGDRKDDIAVWRSNAGNPNLSYFYIFQSLTNTVRIEQFGSIGDDPSVTADYDGDGKSDPAVFRCPDALSSQPGQCYFYYRPSMQPGVKFVSIPFGFGTNETYYPNPGDYDGDGKYDFCLFRDRGSGQGQFVLMRAADFGVEYINWGNFPQDFLAPGDYDGDGKSDFMVVRGVAGQFNWFLLTRTGGGTGASPIIWGLSDGDFITPGDYDGDGKQDISVWRPNADPDQNYYYVRKSGDSGLLTFEWGVEMDYPIQNWFVH
jgi:hypothetical protein